MKRILIMALLCAFPLSCSTASKAVKVRKDAVEASLSLPREAMSRPVEMSMDIPLPSAVKQDEESDVLNAVRDEETGEMVAAQVIDAAITVATFRNVAERGGSVDLKFKVGAPKELLDRNWQLRFTPKLVVFEDTLVLDKVYLTGQQYRRNQLKAYEMYERYLRSIITDSTLFQSRHELEVFLQRAGDVTEDVYDMIVDHYTNRHRKEKNARKLEDREKIFARYVTDPIVKDGLKLDSLLEDPADRLEYEYVHKLITPAGLRRAELFLEGEVYQDNRPVYVIPKAGPITFYISSLSALVREPPENFSDSTYLKGLQAIKDRRYRLAISFLSPYSDYNAALAYSALDYNDKALAILEGLGNSPEVEYMKALLYSRKNDELSALNCYNNACNRDRSYIFRGNLDPEISKLKHKYNLKQ